MPVDLLNKWKMIIEGSIIKLIIELEAKSYRKYAWKNKHGKPIVYV